MNYYRIVISPIEPAPKYFKKYRDFFNWCLEKRTLISPPSAINPWSLVNDDGTWGKAKTQEDAERAGRKEIEWRCMVEQHQIDHYKKTKYVEVRCDLHD